MGKRADRGGVHWRDENWPLLEFEIYWAPLPPPAPPVRGGEPCVVCFYPRKDSALRRPLLLTLQLLLVCCCSNSSADPPPPLQGATGALACGGHTPAAHPRKATHPRPSEATTHPLPTTPPPTRGQLPTPPPWPRPRVHPNGRRPRPKRRRYRSTPHHTATPSQGKQLHKQRQKKRRSQPHAGARPLKKASGEAPEKPLTCIPTPRPQYWWWRKRVKLLASRLKKTSRLDLLFVGDSITHYWELAGERVWRQTFAPLHAFNYGVGGDRVQHILYRVTYGDFANLQPRVVVLMAGTNNLSLKDTPKAVAQGIRAITGQLLKKFPQTHILLLGILPRGYKPNRIWNRCKTTNRLLATFAKQHSQVTFLDLTPHFLGPKGGVILSLYKRDCLHLSSEGYAVWAKAMLPLLRQLRSTP